MKTYNSWKKHLARNGGQCAKCPSVKNLTIDHIIPQQLLHTLGLSEACKYYGENLQILCEPCNKLKGNELDYSNPRTVPLLEKFVEMAILKHTRPLVRKLTARCMCCVMVVEKKPGLAPFIAKPDVVRSKSDVDRSNW